MTVDRRITLIVPPDLDIPEMPKLTLPPPSKARTASIRKADDKQAFEKALCDAGIYALCTAEKRTAAGTWHVLRFVTGYREAMIATDRLRVGGARTVAAILAHHPATEMIR